MTIPDDMQAHNRALMRADRRVVVLSHDMRQPATVA